MMRNEREMRERRSRGNDLRPAHVHTTIRLPGDVDKDVTFLDETDPDVNERIDVAYRTKYRRYAGSIVNSTLTSEARSATIKLVPRSKSS